MVVVVHTKLLPTFQEVPLNLLSEKESVDLLLSTGKVEEVTDDALAAAKKIAQAANYLRTCQYTECMLSDIFIPALYLSILGGVVAQVSNTLNESLILSCLYFFIIFIIVYVLSR